MRLIDADALREVHCNTCSEAIRNGCKDDPVCASLLWVGEAPTVDAVPVKHGRWVWNEESEDGYKHHMCNKCKTNAPYHYTYIDDYDEGLDGEWFYLGQRENGIVEHMGNYCPNCGAKMEADDNDL